MKNSNTYLTLSLEKFYVYYQTVVIFEYQKLKNRNNKFYSSYKFYNMASISVPLITFQINSTNLNYWIHLIYVLHPPTRHCSKNIYILNISRQNPNTSAKIFIKGLNHARPAADPLAVRLIPFPANASPLVGASIAYTHSDAIRCIWKSRELNQYGETRAFPLVPRSSGVHKFRENSIGWKCVRFYRIEFLHFNCGIILFWVLCGVFVFPKWMLVLWFAIPNGVL